MTWDLHAEEEKEEGFWHEKPHDLPLPPGLVLCSTCLLPKAGHSAAAPSPEKVSAIRSLATKVCMLTDSPGPATRDLLLRPGLFPGPTRYLHLLAAQDRPCCCCSSPALLPRSARTSCNGTAAGSWWWLSPLEAILASFYLFYHPPSLPITLNRPSSPSPSPLLRFVTNWLDQYLNRCFLISRRVYICQRTSSPSYKLEWDIWLMTIAGYRIAFF